MSINNGYSTEYSAAYFYMLKENGDWFVQDLKDKYSGGSSNQNSSSDSSESSEEIGGGESITTSIYEIETCSPFKDGRAWVSYEDNQYTYKGFINTQGKILYSERSDEQNTYNIGKGSGLIVTEEACKLINANGEVALTIEGKVEIKAYGGGYAWIYQKRDF